MWVSLRLACVHVSLFYVLKGLVLKKVCFLVLLDCVWDHFCLLLSALELNGISFAVNNSCRAELVACRKLCMGLTH